jgi:3-hydroxyisobutyrate dehydrogenase-like beta-hydroxyacid dehydrogenase
MGQQVAFLGLGVMGYPMAGWLSRAGHDVTVFNRTAAKAQAWCKEHSGVAVGTPAEAAARADIVFTCVGDDPDLRAIVIGDGAVIANMRLGRLEAGLRPLIHMTAPFQPHGHDARAVRSDLVIETVET